MPILGPIRPKYYISYDAVAPNPTPDTTAALNEIVSCPFTGRLWLQRSPVAPSIWSQVLPWVQADGVNPTKGVRMRNIGGDMTLARPQGMTEGAFDMFGVATADPNGFTFPNEEVGPVFLDSDKKLRGRGLAEWKLAGDVSLTANTLTSLSGSNFTALETGLYRIIFGATFQHNNSFDASIGIRYFANANSNSVVRSASCHAQAQGYATAYCEAIVLLSVGESARFVVQATDTGVTVKVNNPVVFPFAGFPQTVDCCTYRVVERIA